MKPKMKDCFANTLALYNMIGQAQDMWEVVEVSHIAAWAGLSKTTILNRLWRFVEVGHIVIHAIEHRNNARKYFVELTPHGIELASSKMAKMEYMSWVSKARHVREIRIGSNKSMFI